MRNLLNVILIFIIWNPVIFASQNEHFSINEKIGSETKISFLIGDISINEVQSHSRIIAPKSGITTEIGKPELPLFTTFFEIEHDVEYEIQYSIRNSHKIENIEIFPVQNFEQNEDDESELIKDETFYESNAVYPSNNITVSEPIIMRGIELLQITFIPFSYSAETKELVVYDDVEISISASGESSIQENIQHKPHSRVFEPFYENMILNYESDLRDEDYQQPAILYICGGNTNINMSFQELLNWRHKQGYVIYSAPTSITGSSANEIKNYIANAYLIYDPPPEFVVLVGDVGGSFDIPTFYENWSICSGYPCYGEGDHPYTQLQGDDILPEVLIGRISIRSYTDLAIAVSKIINYEKAIMPDDNWFEKAASCGNPDIYGGGQSIVTTIQYTDQIMTNYNMEDTRMEIISDATNISNWMNSQLDEGISYLNFRGLYGPASYDIYAITNNLDAHYMLPFISIITCGTGSFAYEPDSHSEMLFRSGVSPANYSGAVAVVGTATWGTHTQFNNIMDMGIFEGIFAQGVEYAGAALQAGKIALLNTYPENPTNYVDIFTHWNNLMGDPSLRLWTDTPQTMVVDYPSNLSYGSDAVIVTITDQFGNAVNDAQVTLLKGDDEIFTTLYSDQNGMAVFDIEYVSDGVIDLTIIKRDHIPFEGTISIENEIYQLTIDEEIIIDDYAVGNGNGQIDPGEICDVSIPLTNISYMELSNVQANLAINSDQITVTNADFNYGSISSGATQSGIFTISIVPEAIYSDDFEFQLTVTDESNNIWTFSMPFTIQAANLIFSGYTFSDPYPFQPGDSVLINIELSNSGNDISGDITGELNFPGNLDLTVIEEVVSWAAIQAGQIGSSENEVLLRLGENFINGSDVEFELHLTSPEGYDQTELINLEFNETAASDPTGPDNYGYYIYDSGDIEYSLAPVHTWQSISPDHGGDGIPLEMLDCGTGIPDYQEAEQIDLPFIFKFYGVLYSSISVTTNGWIVFGDTEMASFRNTAIPGPGGPSPMLAVFWDDLATVIDCQLYDYQIIGDVYYQILEDRVIIEWSGMQTFYGGDPVEFQAVLLDSGELTPTGDDEMLLLYKTFNNTSSGLYLPDYDGLIHGAYCTIGIEDHLGSNGLQYTFNNEYPASAMALEDQTALFITTRQPLNLFTVDIHLGTTPLTVQFAANDNYEPTNWFWDFDNDGTVDAAGLDPEWTYNDIGLFSVKASVLDGSTYYEDTRFNYIQTAIFGCMDPIAENYNPAASFDDGSCTYNLGCMDPTAINYNPDAVVDDGNCFYLQNVVLEAVGIEDNSFYGFSTSIIGNTAIVGAYRKDIAGNFDQGAVYLYQGVNDNGWLPLGEISSSDGEANDYFGYSVSISGDYAVVGAYKDDDGGSGAGAVYIIQEFSETLWIEVEKLTASDAESSDDFGYSVDIDGELVIVGARKGDSETTNNTGAAYIFQRQPDDTWLEVAKLTASNGESNDSFGTSVSLSDNYAIVGANLNDNENGTNAGTVYIFESSDGVNWQEVIMITPEDLTEHSHFGAQVSHKGEVAIFGAMYDDNDIGANAGSAYIYSVEDGNWVFQEKLTGSEGMSGDLFGSTVAIGDNYAAVGSSNKMYIYHYSDVQDWSENAGFISLTNKSAVISGDKLIAGNLTDDIARVYSLSDWSEWENYCACLGDLNDDQIIDILDIVGLISSIMDGIGTNCGDLNCDGIVDILDAIILVNAALSGGDCSEGC